MRSLKTISQLTNCAHLRSKNAIFQDPWWNFVAFSAARLVTVIQFLISFIPIEMEWQNIAPHVRKRGLHWICRIDEVMFRKLFSMSRHLCRQYIQLDHQKEYVDNRSQWNIRIWMLKMQLWKNALEYHSSIAVFDILKCQQQR